ncbi:MAG: hypothetical protein WCJ68_00045 [Chitinophagia bacterium]
MKYVTCSILLFLALSSQLGTYVMYMVQQELNKENIAQQMARALPEEQLVKIKNNPAIKWEEAGKEFYLNGTFYDVVNTKKINGETWYYCINDKMESQLYKNYTASLKSSNETLPASNQGKHVLKFSLSYFILHNNSESVFVFSLLLNKQKN